MLGTDCIAQKYSSDRMHFHLTPNVSQTILVDQDYTSIHISGKPLDLKSIKIQIDSTITSLVDRINFHTEQPSAFVVFENPKKNIKIISEREVEITAQLFYAPSLDLENKFSKNKVDNCEKPTTIPASIWREGLTKPTPGRNATVVKHCIIHHTAGSNTNENFVDVVRNIYLAHTEGNGWDDIGYNYLVAQDGTIFSGRDAQGIADEDNIQGAHFCSKNRGTMGIALLGNFNLTSPNLSQLEALESILNWKLFKESVDPYDQYAHPNSLGSDLGTIGIHKDGCATSCPGDSLALLIPEIRDNVRTTLLACGLPLKIKTLEANKPVSIYPNPSAGNITIRIKNSDMKSYRVVSTFGQILQSGHLKEKTTITIDESNGIYYLLLEDKSGSFQKHKILIINK